MYIFEKIVERTTRYLINGEAIKVRGLFYTTTNIIDGTVTFQTFALYNNAKQKCILTNIFNHYFISPQSPISNGNRKGENN